VFTCHPADTHPDHWATYCFTRLALEELRVRERAAWPRECQLLTYLVHRRGWPAPWGYYPELRLAPPRALVDLPSNEWFRWDLTREQTLAKNRMILNYRSQAASFDFLLRAFARRNELFAAIKDRPSSHIPLWLQPDIGLEPRRETEHLRLHPGADLVRVESSTDDAGASIEITTAAPLSRAQLVVMLTAVAPRPGAVRATLVQVRHGRPTEAWTAGDDDVPTDASSLVRVTTEGTTVTVSVPAAWLGSRRSFTVDVLSAARIRTVDHAITHVVGDGPSGQD